MDYSSEQRQHISISNYAFNIIKNDNYAFTGSRSNTSGFINKIFLNCYEGIQPLEEKLPKENSFKIRPSKDVLEVLFDIEDELVGTGRPFTTRAALFNAILEKYAQLSQYDREAIFFSNHLSIIENELLLSPSDRHILKIKYTTARGESITCEVKPYRLVTDPANTFHYLVGYSKKTKCNRSASYAPFPFRISRIESISPYAKSHGSAKLTIDEQKKLQLDLDLKGVQFMLGDIIEFRVMLTSDGFNMYRSTTHLRPIADEALTTIDADGNTIMTFYCTERQIMQYFFRFGMDAIILSPKETANKVIENYSSALKRYNKFIQDNKVSPLSDEIETSSN